MKDIIRRAAAGTIVKSLTKKRLSECTFIIDEIDEYTVIIRQELMTKKWSWEVLYNGRQLASCNESNTKLEIVKMEAAFAVVDDMFATKYMED